MASGSAIVVVDWVLQNESKVQLECATDSEWKHCQSHIAGNLKCYSAKSKPTLVVVCNTSSLN